MKTKVFVGLLTSFIAAFITRTFVGVWLVEHYAYSGSFFWGFSNPQNFDGFLFSYILFSSVFVSLFSKRIKYGFFSALPIIIFDLLLGSFNPQLWIDLVLLAAGLGIAWGTLKIKKSI